MVYDIWFTTLNLPLNPTLNPSFEIGQEWQYLPRWGIQIGEKNHETVGGKVIYTTILAYILLLHIICTHFDVTLSLSLCAFPRRFFLKPWLFTTFPPPRRTPKQHGCCNATRKRRWKQKWGSFRQLKWGLFYRIHAMGNMEWTNNPGSPRISDFWGFWNTTQKGCWMLISWSCFIPQYPGRFG